MFYFCHVQTYARGIDLQDGLRRSKCIIVNPKPTNLSEQNIKAYQSNNPILHTLRI